MYAIRSYYATKITEDIVIQEMSKKEQKNRLILMQSFGKREDQIMLADELAQ